MSKLNINVQDQVKCINDRLEDIKLLVSEIENENDNNSKAQTICFNHINNELIKLIQF